MNDCTIASVTISPVHSSEWEPHARTGEHARTRPDDALGMRVVWVRRDGRSVTRTARLSVAWEDAERLLAFAEKAKPGDELSFSIDDDPRLDPLELSGTREFLLDVASALEITIARATVQGIAAPEQRIDLVDGRPRRGASSDVAA